jgi:hypothetical protein
MQYAMTISIAAWTLLAAVVIGLAIYRKLVTRGELDLVHIRDSEVALIPQQELLTRRLNWIDQRGKLLTVVMVVYGFLIALVYLVRLWQESNP